MLSLPEFDSFFKVFHDDSSAVFFRIWFLEFISATLRSDCNVTTWLRFGSWRETKEIRVVSINDFSWIRSNVVYSLFEIVEF